MNPTLTRTLRWFGLLEAGRRVELRLRLREARALPDAMIIGAMKWGTSSLHYYLTQHPQVIPPLRKEVHYFDLNYARGEAWYRAQLRPGRAARAQHRQQPVLPVSSRWCRNARALVPHAKLIVLLRDPVRRAYSHYWHERDKGREKLSFEDAIAAEPERIDREHERLARGEIERSAAHQYFSYLARGRYAEQIERWLRFYPRERLLSCGSRIWRRSPAGAEPVACVPRAAGDGSARLEPRNTRKYPPIEPATAERLREYFEPHNAR